MKSPTPLLLAAMLGGLFPVSAMAADGITASPLADRSGEGERMHFTAIPASESGLQVENPYDERSMWSSHYTEFQGGAIGTGIAAGDVDGDGQVDLYVVNKSRPNQLFRQVAPFRFEDITATAGVPGGEAWQTGATFADIDNDGDLDLYVCQFDAPNLLYLNDGAGRFTEDAVARGVALVSSSVVGAFADYDRDGHLDLFVVTNVQDAATSPDGEPDTLYRNRGDGTFEDVTAAAGIPAEAARGHSATWFDANADGWPDLYVANDFAKPDHLYQNNGDGTFTDTRDRDLPSTPWFSMGADFGDINNDGLFDLFVADMAGTTHFKSKVTMGDMGGLVDAMDRLDTPQYMRNALYLNSGTNRFLEIAQMAGVKSSDWSWSPRFEDLDNDGWLDLHITNGMVRSFIDSDLVNATRRLTSQRDVIRTMKNSPPLEEAHLMFRNDGDLHFDKVQDDWGLDHTGVSFGSAFADFDRDGDLDLAYINHDDTVSLYRNDSPRGGRVVIELIGTASNSQGIGAQAFVESPQGRQTRQLTVARGALSSSEPILHFGLGDADTLSSLEIRWPSGQTQHFTDLATNTRYTITEPRGDVPQNPAMASRVPAPDALLMETAAKRGLDFTNREQFFNDMMRQSLLPNRMNTLGGGLAVGDADGDGDHDIFFAGGTGQTSALYLNDGTGHFSTSTTPQPWETQTEIEHMAPLWVDLERDGDLDLIVSVGGVEVDAGSDELRNQLYLNDGTGTFVLGDFGQINADLNSSSVTTAADFDRDGDLDLFIGGRVVAGAYPTVPESQLLENRNGRLVDITPDTLRHVGMVTSALWTDADGDGRVDLLVAGEWIPLTLFHNTGTTLERSATVTGFAEHPGWWNSLAAADVDHDGDLDYIAGNFGLNTKYHADHEHPVQLFYGDFEGTGACEIVEAEYEGDNLFPVRGRSCSSRAMPSLAEKFPTFRDFGAALLPEIYTEEKLEESLKVEVTQLASGIFINEGDAHFSFRPLPRLAQTAPIFGLAATDLTGDGHIDILATQNFHGPQVETGRYNGGISLLLAGDGNGNFAALPATSSGIAITGEGRGLALTDLDQNGRPDFVLTRINESTQAYFPAPGATSSNASSTFAIKLNGETGNPDAIGATIIAYYADGRAHAVELHAGSGYLTQSAPLAFFTGRPKSIEVTWPDGRRTTHRNPQGSSVVELSPATE